MVAHVIIVSAQSKELGFCFFFFLTWSDLRVRIWGLLGQGIGDLDSGFDNMNSTKLHDFMIYWQEDFYGVFYIE